MSSSLILAWYPAGIVAAWLRRVLESRGIEADRIPKAAISDVVRLLIKMPLDPEIRQIADDLNIHPRSVVEDGSLLQRIGSTGQFTPVDMLGMTELYELLEKIELAGIAADYLGVVVA